MTAVQITVAAAGLVAVGVLFSLAWRWASRVWQLPCPSLLASTLESPLYQRLTGTAVTLDRIGICPGQKVLEIGPGPGRILIPAAQRALPGGEAVGIDIQPGMIERLKARAAQSNINNLTAILGDATRLQVPEESVDVAILCTTLGEIPDRSAVLAQCFRALKPGGVLSITEMFPDPHYQSQSTLKRLAEAAGF
ncbi:MAG: class I SAM-dependent methyltransferase, partial [Deltaproteobacteria bacterium]